SGDRSEPSEPPSAGTFVEGRRDDDRRLEPAADREGEARSGLPGRQGQVGGPDVFLEEGGEAAARHGADRLATVLRLIAVTRDRATFGLESHEPAREPVRLLTEEGVAADEVALLELQDPAEV